MSDDILVRPSGLVIRHVSGTLYRGAQPKDLADWAFLRDDLGVTKRVKLNTESEGSDNGARALGLVVYDCSIQPTTDEGLVATVEAIFEKPDMEKVERALEIMASGNVFVGCLHGQDRTGLLCALYRVRYDGWSTTAAWEEALALGYHPEFVGLDRAWFEQTGRGRLAP